MSKQGRPSKLTPQLQERIIQALRWGNFIDTACLFGGIDKTSFFRYMRIGAQSSEGIYHDFFWAVNKAQAEGEIFLVHQIRNAATRDWCASAFMLERKFPKKWALRECLQEKVE